ncbi:MAG: zinc-dependent metalloprotease [Acidimicrobiales bacterium]
MNDADRPGEEPPEEPNGGPPGFGSPFGGLPFLGDLMRLVNSQGSSPWDGATQLAVSIASGGKSEPNVDPADRIELERFADIARMHVEALSTQPLTPAGTTLTVVPVTRGIWARQALTDYRSLLEQLSASLNQSPGFGLGGPGGLGGDLGGVGGAANPLDAFNAMISGLMQMMGPMMLSMTAGSMVGHLAERALGTYHLPLPRPAGAPLQVVMPNVNDFAEEWSIEASQLRMWVCLSELVQHRVLGQPHVAQRVNEALSRYVRGFKAEPGAMESLLGGLDPAGMDLTDLNSLSDTTGLAKLLGDPTALLGAFRSPEQTAMLPALQAMAATIVGYVDYRMDELGRRLLGGAGRLAEALRRRRVEASSADQFVERLLGLELTQSTYDRGAAFVSGVVERAGDEALERLWEQPETFPTTAEIEAPGLWLARIEFISPPDGSSPG